jgi:YD repeat-containing protein
MQTSENYNNSSTNPSRTMYKYDDNGNRTEDIILDPISGSIIKRFIKVYDRQGNLIEQYMNNKNNGRVSYKYDRFGNILEEKDETFGPKITKYVYQYF